MQAPRRRSTGFTLIELIIVVAVVGILTAVGAVALGAGRFAVNQGAQVVSGAVTKARFEAIRQNRTAQIVFDTTGNGSYSIAVDEDDDGTFATTEVTESQTFGTDNLAKVSLSATTLNNGRIRFDRRGIPMEGAFLARPHGEPDERELQPHDRHQRHREGEHPMTTPQRGARTRGLTLIELLIALAIIGIAFLALALSQVNQLRASSRSQVLTTVKTAANQVLEQQTSRVLKALSVTSGSSWEDLVQAGGDSLSFKFVDYYHYCTTGANESGLRTDYRTQDATQADSANHIGACSGSETVDNTTVDWQISPPTSYASYDTEGVLDIVATGTQNNITLTVGNAITCYDVYPSPKLGTPKPCPDPETP